MSSLLDLITSEHANKPNFMAMVAVTIQPAVDLFSLYGEIPSLYDVDSAVGGQLDVIGQWVGVDRYLSAPLAGVYFSFDTADIGLDQGVWIGPYDPVSGLVRLPDDYYRVILYAKILNNHWDGSLIAAYELSDILFNSFAYSLFIDDQSNLTIYIGLIGPGVPPAIVMGLLTSGKLDIKPATIRVAGYITQSSAGAMFAFDLSNTHFAGFDESEWATITLP